MCMCVPPCNLWNHVCSQKFGINIMPMEAPPNVFNINMVIICSWRTILFYGSRSTQYKTLISIRTLEEKYLFHFTFPWQTWHIMHAHTHEAYMYVCMQVGCPVYSDGNMQSWILNYKYYISIIFQKFNMLQHMLWNSNIWFMRDITHTHTHTHTIHRQ